MKVSIVSIVDDNHGNRLQCYALDKTVSKLVKCKPVVCKIGAGCDARLLKRIGRKAREVSALCKDRKRKAHFNGFSREHMEVLSLSGESLAKRDGVFVIGSDQCWNPSWNIGAREDGAQCVFGAEPWRKVAYAASFGIKIKDIEHEWRSRYASWLREIDSISMREDAGAAIVRELTGRDVPVVLDPTMLLSPEEWVRVEKRPRISDLEPGSFCLKYVLGDDVNEDEISRLASERGFGVVDLGDKALPVGPAEFVWLVRNSGFVCTDSFHASVFSVLFHRSFIIFERRSDDADMSSRFDTLCRIFSLQHHRFGDPGFDLARCFDEDWERIDAILAKERTRSLRWLGGALCSAISIEECN